MPGLLAALALAMSLDPASTYSGRQEQTAVRPPRIEADLDVDGVLNEPVWQRAAWLTDFSQYSPADGTPAQQSTMVAVWYSPTAIYFGIRAEAAAGTVRATLADRDKLTSDDTVQIYLSTFNDDRQALFFGVNPLGVQEDGALVEGTRTGGNGFSGLQVGHESPDLTPDFVFESKGRVTPEGFEVEVRIPFKSLRYQSAPSQTWGMHIIRHSQASGHEDSWAPARREGSSFLAQAGRLDELTDLRRGLVVDLNPVATMRIDGASGEPGWTYDASRPEFGANLRWGITSNLVLNGTVNPDFSQVESDAGQLVTDPRQAIYYAEKRPFFLDGIEQFSTPNNLIYTRRIVAPVAAAKLTGSVRGTSLAFLSAVDDSSLSASREDHPLFNILRVQRDVGGQSRVGFVYTDRLDGRLADRVAGADGRFVIRNRYTLVGQAAVSRSTLDGVITPAPMWDTSFARNGRRYSFRYQFRGIDPDFRAASGFFSRIGIIQSRASNQFTFRGAPGAVLEQLSTELSLDGIWRYGGFGHGEGALERKAHINNNFALRGGWRAGASVLVESYGFDRDAYSRYAVATPRADGSYEVRPFVGTPRLPNLDYVLTFTSPPRRGLSTNVLYLWGRDENFYEWSSANIRYGTINVLWRPTEKLRADLSYQLQTYDRRSNDTRVGSRHLPRLKVEYQMTRSIFVRWVGEYDVERQADLYDDTRSNWPILVRNSSGAYQLARGFARASLRQDLLFSYQPTPGTVMFAGYGATQLSRDPLRTAPLLRAADGFFLKASYLVRL